MTRRAPISRREIVRLDDLVPSGRRADRPGQRVFGDAIRAAGHGTPKRMAKTRPKRKAKV